MLSTLCTKYADIMPKRIPAVERQCFDLAMTEWTAKGFNVANYRNLIWLELNKPQTPTLCPICDTPVNWNIARKQYNTFCSNACVRASDEVKQKARDSLIRVAEQAVKTRKTTNKHRYGNSNYLASELGRTKTMQTLKQKYNVENVSQILEVQAKKRANSIIKYGVPHPSMSPEIQTKLKLTNNLKYGRNSWAQKHLSDGTINNLLNRDWMYNNHITLKKTLSEISAMCQGVDVTTISRYMHYHGIYVQHYTCYTSSHERALADWLTSIGVVFQQNDRTIIKPQELDIVIPHIKLAIEMCGVYWHGDWRLPRTYHADKRAQCVEAGYRLLTIFEDEWVYNTNLVKRKILNALGMQRDDKVNSRDTDVIEIDSAVRAQFLNANHIQGDGPGSITYALSHQGRIVAVATLIQQSKCLLLNRYATNCNVRGGFSKIMSHVQKRHPNLDIETFADLRWSDGNLYSTTGFVEVKRYGPMYCYVVNKQRIHRSQFRKKYLKDRLKTYDPSLTEFENCDNNGITRLWDCGMIKYVKYANT